MNFRRSWLWALVPLAFLLAAGWMVSLRTAEERILRQARANLDGGESEAALLALEPIWRRPLPSRASRRQAAELYFRLGEDKKALGMLAGQPFSEQNPSDLRLRQLSARCQRAASLLDRASTATRPAERLQLFRAAAEEVPESPRALHYLVREEWLASVWAADPRVERSFKEDYLALRRMAPRLSDALEAEVREELRRRTGSEKNAEGTSSRSAPSR